MVSSRINTTLKRLKDNLETAKLQGLDLTKSPQPSKILYNFKEKRAQYFKDMIQGHIRELKKSSADLLRMTAGKKDEKKAYDLSVKTRFLEEYLKRPEKALEIVEDMIKTLEGVEITPPQRRGLIDFTPPRLPDDIKGELSADIRELENCFNAGCYRSCIILCGRVLETALHRKYYEATGQDILEKSPGIGLGNLIGKLKDKDALFDPGLSQQIHLINQVRIFSVHKKQEVFNPSKEQTQAIILYTLDVVRRII